MLTFIQRRLMYHPERGGQLSVQRNAPVCELFPASRDVEVTCADGVTIRGWLLLKGPAREETRRPRPLVIYFHGNAGNRVSRTGWYALLEQLGTDVLAMDYHGYGDSEGRMSETALEHDCDAAWTFATAELGYAPSDILVMGTSLGGAAAVYLTAKQCEAGNVPAAMVTVATFSSMVDVAGSLYPWLPTRAVLVDRYPSHERAARITCPVLMLHGDRDSVVHHRFGEKLFASVPEQSRCGVSKRWICLPNIGHNDILRRAGSTLLVETNQLISQIRD